MTAGAGAGGGGCRIGQGHWQRGAATGRCKIAVIDPKQGKRAAQDEEPLSRLRAPLLGAAGLNCPRALSTGIILQFEIETELSSGERWCQQVLLRNCRWLWRVLLCINLRTALSVGPLQEKVAQHAADRELVLNARRWRAAAQRRGAGLAANLAVLPYTYVNSMSQRLTDQPCPLPETPEPHALLYTLAGPEVCGPPRWPPTRKTPLAQLL